MENDGVDPPEIRQKLPNNANLNNNVMHKYLSITISSNYQLHLLLVTLAHYMNFYPNITNCQTHMQ